MRNASQVVTAPATSSPMSRPISRTGPIGMRSTRPEYTLIPTGTSLIPPALALADWAIDHVPAIEASRTAYESRPGRG
ncbi:hypothetical protein AB0G04_28335 [Actinoplanes sp. NPDC023801]|uniref:hypothetical protein n=1 Tax=Actinoplanes sp. NPDC023801 TaxID=3154595 RepID=UPI0033C418D3